MTRYKDIAEQFNRTQQQLRELDEEYSNKPRGNAYTKRKMQLIEKADAFYFVIKELNTIRMLLIDGENIDYGAARTETAGYLCQSRSFISHINELFYQIQNFISFTRL